MAIRIIFTDIDGTLTINRDSYFLDMEAVAALREAVSHGIKVSLVSSNAIPVVIGLSRYLGLEGPAIGESGNLIYTDKGELIKLSNRSARRVYEDILGSFNECLENTWQNEFRLLEFALKLSPTCVSRAKEIVAELSDYVKKRYSGFSVRYSGYAIHIGPEDVNKGTAVRKVLQLYGIDPSEAAAIGDSEMDADMMKEVGASIAVGNAEEELKRACRIVTRGPSGKGVAEFIRSILGAR